MVMDMLAKGLKKLFPRPYNTFNAVLYLGRTSRMLFVQPMEAPKSFVVCTRKASCWEALYLIFSTINRIGLSVLFLIN